MQLFCAASSSPFFFCFKAVHLQLVFSYTDKCVLMLLGPQVRKSY